MIHATTHAVVHLPTTEQSTTECGFIGTCPMPTCTLDASWTQRYYAGTNRTIWIWHCTACGNGQSAT